MLKHVGLVIDNSCNLESPAIGVFFTKPHLDSSAGPLGGKHATAAFIESRPAAVWGSIQSTTCRKHSLEDLGSYVCSVILQWNHQDFWRNGELWLPSGNLT